MTGTKIEKLCNAKSLRKRMRRKVLLEVLFCCIMLSGCATNVDEELSWKLDLEEVQSQQNASEVPDEVSEIVASQELQVIYVYICGAVVRPGVYEMVEGSRVYEAVALAGGVTKEADDTCINMARIVADGEQITILTKEEASKMQELSVSEQKSGRKMVNINTASVLELTQLSGIGETRAQAIIAYREEKGAFQSIEQIKNVSGIKAGLYEKIKDYITVG